jgi:nitrogen PTS system EIIA component
MPTQDFNVESLARYLHLSPPQVTRLVERGKLPGRKVAGQWRFAKADIHHWIEQRIGLADEEELLEVESVLAAPHGSEAEQAGEICIAEMLPIEAIAVPLDSRTRESVFRAVVGVAERTGWLWDSAKMVEAIRVREEMYSTVLESGVALLHPRRPMPGILAQAFLALGVTSRGIPFGGNRGVLTDIFFLICSVEDRGHLKTLARLSRILASGGFLNALRQAPDAQTAHELIAATECGL